MDFSTVRSWIKTASEVVRNILWLLFVGGRTIVAIGGIALTLLILLVVVQSDLASYEMNCGSGNIIVTSYDEQDLALYPVLTYKQSGVPERVFHTPRTFPSLKYSDLQDIACNEDGVTFEAYMNGSWASYQLFFNGDSPLEVKK